MTLKKRRKKNKEFFLINKERKRSKEKRKIEKEGKEIEEGGGEKDEKRTGAPRKPLGHSCFKPLPQQQPLRNACVLFALYKQTGVAHITLQSSIQRQPVFF